MKVRSSPPITTVGRQLLWAVSAILFAAPTGLEAQSPAARNTPTSRSETPEGRELPRDQQIIHALTRLTFGPRPGDVQQVRAMALDKWIDRQLHPERIDDSRLDAFVARYPTINRSQDDLLRQY